MKIYSVNENPLKKPQPNYKAAINEKLEELIKIAEQKEAARYGRKPTPPSPPSPPPQRYSGEQWWNNI